LTFDSKYNWIFKSTGPDISYATAFCLPLSAISNGGGNEYYGVSLSSPPEYIAYQIPVQAGSFCSIAGVGGALAKGANGLLVQPSGYMVNYGTPPANPSSIVFGNCVQFFGSNSAPPATLYSVTTEQSDNGNNGTFMGSASNQICGLYDIEERGAPLSPEQPFLYTITIDDDNNYWFQVLYAGAQTYAWAACVPIRQP
jgi:hypothetical protein